MPGSALGAASRPVGADRPVLPPPLPPLPRRPVPLVLRAAVLRAVELRVVVLVLRPAAVRPAAALRAVVPRDVSARAVPVRPLLARPPERPVLLRALAAGRARAAEREPAAVAGAVVELGAGSGADFGSGAGGVVAAGEGVEPAGGVGVVAMVRGWGVRELREGMAERPQGGATAAVAEACCMGWPSRRVPRNR
jgi:hypothetical protein